jgi:hypothetical protein
MCVIQKRDCALDLATMVNCRQKTSDALPGLARSHHIHKSYGVHTQHSRIEAVESNLRLEEYWHVPPRFDARRRNRTAHSGYYSYTQRLGLTCTSPSSEAVFSSADSAFAEIR